MFTPQSKSFILLLNYFKGFPVGEERDEAVTKLMVSLYIKRHEIESTRKFGCDCLNISITNVKDEKVKKVYEVLKDYVIELRDYFSEEEINDLLADYAEIVTTCYLFPTTPKDIESIDRIRLSLHEIALYTLFLGAQDGSSTYIPFTEIDRFIPYTSKLNSLPQTSGIKLYGVAKNATRWAFTQIYADTFDLNVEIKTLDSTIDYKNAPSKFEKIIALPPLGLDGELNEYEAIKYTIDKDLEDGGTILFTLPETFCYSEAQKSIRQYLIDNRYLALVISMPSACSYDNDVNKYVFVAKKNKQEKILFVNGSSFAEKDESDYYVLQDTALLDAIDKEDKNFCKFVKFEEISSNYFDLRPGRYLYELPEMENPTKLRDVLKIWETFETTKAAAYYDNPNYLEFDISSGEGKKRCIKSGGFGYICGVNFGKFEFSSIGNSILPGNNICLRDGDFAFNLTNINREYFEDIMRTSLVENQIKVLLKEDPDSFNEIISVEDFLDITIPLPSLNKQKEIVAKKRERYKLQKQASNTYSDLAHMLGTPSSKISAALDILAENKDLSPIEQKAIKSIYANLGFMNRLLEMNLNSNIWDGEKEPICLYDFLETYKENWDFYGAKTFYLEIESAEELKKATVLANKDALTMFFDCLLDNANRHGFHKQKKAENKVEIYLSNPSKEQLPEALEQIKTSELPTQIVLLVSNNGELLPPTFTFDDYITKGRYSSETGRTGLGGYHVNEIAKSMGGKLTDIFETKDEWEVFEFTIPIHSTKD